MRFDGRRRPRDGPRGGVVPRRSRPRGRGLPGPHAPPAAAAGGRARRGQDRGRPDPGAGAGRRADPPPVLRGHRRRPGPVRVGLLAPAPLRPHDPGRPARPLPSRRRALRPGVPGGAAAAARGAGGGRRGAAGGRAGPRRRGVRGLPARGARRLGGDDPGDRHGDGRAAAGGDPDLQPHPRAARRPQAPVPLPLDRLPRPWSARRRSSGCGRPRRRRRSRGRWPRSSRGCARWTSSSGPGRPRPSTGAARSRPSASGRSMPTPPTRRWAGWSRTATTSRWCAGRCRSCWRDERARDPPGPRARAARGGRAGGHRADPGLRAGRRVAGAGRPLLGGPRHAHLPARGHPGVRPGVRGRVRHRRPPRTGVPAGGRPASPASSPRASCRSRRGPARRATRRASPAPSRASGARASRTAPRPSSRCSPA